MGVAEPKSNEIQRFELLRNELMELEKRLQDQSYSEEVPLSGFQEPNNLAIYNFCRMWFEVLLFVVARKKYVNSTLPTVIQGICLFTHFYANTNKNHLIMESIARKKPTMD